MDYNFWTDQEVMDVMQDVIDLFLIPRYNELGMRASGEWEQSLEANRTDINRAVIRGRFYSEFLAKGRNPNKDQSPEAIRRWAVWAGKTFIKDWAEQKGVTADPIAIAYNIAKNGTSWTRKGGSDLLEVLTEPATIEYVRARLGKILKVKITEQLRRNAFDALNNR